MITFMKQGMILGMILLVMIIANYFVIRSYTDQIDRLEIQVEENNRFTIDNRKAVELWDAVKFTCKSSDPQLNPVKLANGNLGYTISCQAPNSI